MRLRSQFIISLVAFTIVLIIIGASIANTEQQTESLANQQIISSNIERGASALNSVSIDYFLYQEDLQISKWNSTISSLSSDLQNLEFKDDKQQTLASNVAKDLQTLNAQFEDVTTFLLNSSRNVSVRIDPAFQFRWSNMALQSQTLASDASQLSQSITDQIHQHNSENALLILALVGTFGVFLLTIYLLVFRRTLRSVAGLQKGIGTIGTGNLDYKIEIQGQNEITELSSAFNKMTSNLKTVTASKTELEMAQTLLRESEQRWATTLSSIGDAVIATDTGGNVVFMNRVAEELTGWKLNEASGKAVKEIFNIVNEQSRLTVEDPVAKVLERGVIVGLANHTVLIRKDGLDLPIDDSGAPILSREGKITGAVLIFRDITERKKAEDALKERTEKLEFTQTKLEENACMLEEYSTQMEALANERLKKLQDSERLAAIGATAGMVGHDIRNPLQAITGDVFLAKGELANMPESDEKTNALESLNEIEKNIEYINKIVQDLQDYARPLNPKSEESDLKEVVESILKKSNQIPQNVKIIVHIADDARKIKADAYYLNRILYNLITNSVQALPNGGKINIKAIKDNETTVLSVEDTGPGIPQEVQAKMFSLMFTTKAKGQGFGLPVVKRMTESLGGDVTFKSQEGKGTQFIVRLPSKQ